MTANRVVLAALLTRRAVADELVSFPQMRCNALIVLGRVRVRRGLPVSTIDSHVAAVLDKLGSRTRKDAVSRAAGLGITLRS